MKKAWTRGEKWLLATPLLVGVFVGGATVASQIARRITGTPESLTTPPGTQLRSMALSRNGEVVAAAGLRRTPKGKDYRNAKVFLWNTHTNEPLAPAASNSLSGRNDFATGHDVYALAFSPDAKQIGFSRDFGTWTLYDVATQKPLWRFSSPAEDAEFSHDGRLIALAGGIHISIVDAQSGKIRTRLKRSGAPNSRDISWSPDGALIATIGSYKSNNPIELYRSSNGKLALRIQSAQNMRGETVASVSFSPDSKRVVTASSVGGYSSKEDFSKFAPVRCYHAETGKLLWEIKSPDLGGADAIHSAFCDAVFSPDGHTVAAYQFNKGQIFLLDGSTGSLKATLQLGKATHSTFFVPPGLAFSPDGKRLYARGGDAVLQWDLE